MTDKLDKDALTEAFEYLDDLRESGRANMWGASGYVVEELKWDSASALLATGLWMNTFDDTPAECRVDAALAKQETTA